MHPQIILEKNILVCPETKSGFSIGNNELTSREGKKYLIRDDGKIDFIGLSRREEFKQQRDFFDKIKAFAKKLIGNKYPLLVKIISPVMWRIHWPTLSTYWSYLVKKYTSDREVVLQVGSGNDSAGNKIINIDIFDYQEVDIIADCTKLPFNDNSVDVILSFAVLEHVEDPRLFLIEANRVLKKDGIIMTGLPFIAGFHASPHDYYRWTDKGLETFHSQNGFQKIEIIPGNGPASGFLWILQEFLAILLSFNINVLYYFWYFVFLILLFPIKLLDIILVHYKQGSKIEAFYYYIGKKI